ncbi:DnaJ domain-containing protein [Abiotrophia defectiva]|uniref:DnaJ domain-containing protein n=2 Tax=Abiotrophia defectiva TaxID=46125 RepID=UPI0028D29D7B|nr:DnaJ domain-containing protein [Abiotrophia defectiva]
MAKTPWQVLGLAGPTSDKKAIKRAYAQQVKLYHPEDHPEEFQALQAAYQEALKRATELAAQESRGAGADFVGGRDPKAASQPSDFGKQAKSQPSDQEPAQSADQKPG